VRARKHFTSWSGASYYEGAKELWKDHKVVVQFSLSNDWVNASDLYLQECFFVVKYYNDLSFDKTRKLAAYYLVFPLCPSRY
jgi:hypothetical protein